MKTTRELTRLAVARRLQDVAVRIAAGRPVRVGGVAVLVPDRIPASTRSFKPRTKRPSSRWS
jgi:hypothetical protein